MNRIRVLLSIEQQLCQQVLRYDIEQHSDTEVIGESCNFFECLALIDQHQPQLWIHSWSDGPELSAVLSHALEMAPNLRIVHFNPAESAGILQVRVNSLSDMLGLASCDPEPVAP
ncbi:response regulator [Aureliella helgolandensis]|nr:hypothetical protein [Aureliella helgolandensis]